MRKIGRKSNLLKKIRVDSVSPKEQHFSKMIREVVVTVLRRLSYQCRNPNKGNECQLSSNKSSLSLNMTKESMKNFYLMRKLKRRNKNRMLMRKESKGQVLTRLKIGILLTCNESERRSLPRNSQSSKFKNSFAKIIYKFVKVS